MGQTPARYPVTFLTRQRRISIRKTSQNHFSVCVESRNWRITKASLCWQNVQWFTLLAHSARPQTLRRPIRLLRKRSPNYSLNGTKSQKTTGINWISLRMANGAQPLILKAPSIFRGALLYIEATENPNTFMMRVIDPQTDQRTEPLEITRDIVEATVRTLNNADTQPDHELSTVTR